MRQGPSHKRCVSLRRVSDTIPVLFFFFNISDLSSTRGVRQSEFHPNLRGGLLLHHHLGYPTFLSKERPGYGRV